MIPPILCCNIVTGSFEVKMNSMSGDRLFILKSSCMKIYDLKGVSTMFCESCGGNCVKIVEDGFIRQQCSSCNKVYYKNPYPWFLLVFEKGVTIHS